MSAASDIALEGGGLFDPTAPLTPTGNLRRRSLVNRAVEGGATVAALIAVGLLTVLVVGVLTRGLHVLSFGFLFDTPQGLAGGGIVNYILGTMVIVAFGAVIAIPVGVLAGLYLTELVGARSRVGRVLQLSLDIMQGIPTIVVGLFVYGLIVATQHLQTGWAAGVGLAIVMLPLIARSSQEVLLLVPGTLREAADALGVERWRTVLGVILPSAAGGILTGAILAVARAAGETAPLLILNPLYDPNTIQLNIFTHGVPSVPMLILTTTDLAIPEAFNRAWGAALALLFIILVANILARVLLARSRAKMGA